MNENLCAERIAKTFWSKVKNDNQDIPDNFSTMLNVGNQPECTSIFRGDPIVSGVRISEFISQQAPFNMKVNKIDRNLNYMSICAEKVNDDSKGFELKITETAYVPK